MFKKVILASSIAALSTGALAETYQVEAGAMFASSDFAGKDVTTLGVGATYHFSAVDTNGKPYYEADFMQRSSNIFGSYSSFDSDGVDGSNLLIGGEFYIPGDLFYISADYARHESGDNDSSHYAVTGGVTPIDGLLVTTTYVEDVDYDLNLAAKYVTAVGNGQFVTVRGGVVNGDDDTTLSAGADYYFNQATSIGLDVISVDSDTAFGLNARHFFTPMAYAGVSYFSSDAVDTVAIEAGFRF